MNTLPPFSAPSSGKRAAAAVIAAAFGSGLPRLPRLLPAALPAGAAASLLPVLVLALTLAMTATTAGAQDNGDAQGGLPAGSVSVTGNQAEPASGPSAPTATPTERNPVIVLETTLGDITVELWADKAPLTVENFLRYTDQGFYDGLIFHRVIPGFMIQGGGLHPSMDPKAPFNPIKNEARADAPNNRGTIAMARTSIIDSATSQFFINVADNAFLNHQDDTQSGFGYAVFGEVIGGMDVVDAIAAVATGTNGPYRDVPVEPVVILSSKRGFPLSPPAEATAATAGASDGVDDNEDVNEDDSEGGETAAGDSRADTEETANSDDPDDRG